MNTQPGRKKFELQSVALLSSNGSEPGSLTNTQCYAGQIFLRCGRGRFRSEWSGGGHTPGAGAFDGFGVGGKRLDRRRHTLGRNHATGLPARSLFGNPSIRHRLAFSPAIAAREIWSELDSTRIPSRAPFR